MAYATVKHLFRVADYSSIKFLKSLQKGDNLYAVIDPLGTYILQMDLSFIFRVLESFIIGGVTPFTCISTMGQYSKADDWISLTLLGISTYSKDSQFPKAFASILVGPSGIIIFFTFLL